MNGLGPRSIPGPRYNSRRRGRQGKGARSGGPGERLWCNHTVWRGKNHDSSDKATQESQAPREPVSTPKAAILCINATLDIDTAPGKAVESASALDGTRNGAIVTVDRVPPGHRVPGPHGGGRNPDSSPGPAKPACSSSLHLARASA